MRRTIGEPEAREFMKRHYEEVRHGGNPEALAAVFSAWGT